MHLAAGFVRLEQQLAGGGEVAGVTVSLQTDAVHIGAGLGFGLRRRGQGKAEADVGLAAAHQRGGSQVTAEQTPGRRGEGVGIEIEGRA